ncbi:Protein of unknown function [Cotesia congregata]|uniref:Uncharacterized protein n=1 Tax=Cotesia congregata TaxID=51543 RepID=A0A8J2H6V3_COTCN|nr:Protein of unknown function [Cotesia congregata]
MNNNQQPTSRDEIYFGKSISGIKVAFLIMIIGRLKTKIHSTTKNRVLNRIKITASSVGQLSLCLYCKSRLSNSVTSVGSSLQSRIAEITNKCSKIVVESNILKRDEDITPYRRKPSYLCELFIECTDERRSERFAVKRNNINLILRLYFTCGDLSVNV